MFLILLNSYIVSLVPEQPCVRAVFEWASFLQLDTWKHPQLKASSTSSLAISLKFGSFSKNQILLLLKESFACLKTVELGIPRFSQTPIYTSPGTHTYSCLILFINMNNMGVLSKEHSILALKSSHTSWAMLYASSNGHYYTSCSEVYVLCTAFKVALLLKKDLGNEYVLKEQFRRDKLNAALGFQTGGIILWQYFIWQF